MQSFVTILMAGCAACMAMFMLSPESNDQNQLYALEITLEENGERFSAPKVVVTAGESYVIALAAGAEYDVAIDIPKDTREVKDPFARDLEHEAGAYLKLNAELSVDDDVSPVTFPDYGKLISSSLLLSLAEPAREIRSIIPVSGRGLLTRAGQPIESLAITIKGTPLAR